MVEWSKLGQPDSQTDQLAPLGHISDISEPELFKTLQSDRVIEDFKVAIPKDKKQIAKNPCMENHTIDVEVMC